MLVTAVVALIACAPAVRAQTSGPDLEQEIRQRAAQIEDQLIAWRRDIHEHPELGEQETRTAALVAEHLTKLGLEVRTGVAQTGIVALLRGGKPGPVVALRADMDALPVKEPGQVIGSSESVCDPSLVAMRANPPRFGSAARAGRPPS
jgi:amidohydrolase